MRLSRVILYLTRIHLNEEKKTTVNTQFNNNQMSLFLQTLYNFKQGGNYDKDFVFRRVTVLPSIRCVCCLQLQLVHRLLRLAHN